MKPTAILVAVMLLLRGILFVGCSFNTEKKAGTATHGSELILPEVSLKGEKAAPVPLPVYKQEAPKVAKFELINTYIKTSVDEGPGTDYDIIPPSVEEDSISKKEEDSIAFFMCNLEVEAEYPGGTAAWQRYLNKNMRFPVDSIDNETQGSVVVRFVVDEAGNVCDVEAVNGSAALAAEAVRVIKQSGKWIPAKQFSTGRCVRSFKTQPFVICFEVEE
jgi:periplasmic protein TonB